MSDLTVDVYSKPMCVQCERTKDFLKRNDIKFSTTDVTQDADALSYIKNDLGYNQAPVVVLKRDGAVIDSWSGMNDAKLKKLVRASV